MKKSSLANFYCYKYRQYLVKHVSEEKQRETDAFLRDVKEHRFTVDWYLKDIKAMSEEDVKHLYVSHAKRLDEFKDRIDNLERYNYFISCIEDDYYFDAEMLKGIDRYNKYNK